MKTIAITIEESILSRIDRLMNEDPQWKSRSEVIRKAVREFVTRLERVTEEEREREIFSQHSARLKRQAVALVKEQAKV